MGPITMLERDFLGRARCTFNYTIMQCPTPRMLKLSFRQLALPVFTDGIVSRDSLTQKSSRHFVERFSSKQRSDKRLDNRDCAIVCTGVAPCFKRVGFWNMPVTEC